MIDLQEVLRLHGMWRRGEEGGAHANLTYANLTDANLKGANLTHANLTDANLKGANLTYANLTDANLTDANLKGANLTYANLTDANLTHANLTDANLRDANLTDANLTDANLRGANLRGADLRGANLRGELVSLLRVPSLHSRMLAAIEAGAALEMGSWHLNNASCGTQHCRAGWNIHFAGPAGATLEALWGPAAAGAVIAAVSCPYLERVPDFYCSNQDALADIKRCAAIEAEQGA